MSAELFNAEQTPFNLAGEKEEPPNHCERCGEAMLSSLPHCARCHRELWQERERNQRTFFECGGTFDGFTCGTDADPGL